MGKTLIQLLTPTEGEILLNGENIATLSPKEVRQKRRDMQIIFQDPFLPLILV